VTKDFQGFWKVEDAGGRARHNMDKTLKMVDKITGVCLEPPCFEDVLQSCGAAPRFAA